MKKILTLVTAICCLLPLNSQSSQELVTTSSDLVGQNFSVVAPMMIQATTDQFYWIGGCSSGDDLEHLTFINNSDYDNLIIARYEKGGKIIYHKIVTGSKQMKGGFSFHGDLTILGQYTSEIYADDLILPASLASSSEFLVSYLDGGLAYKLVPVWENMGNESPNSSLAMDPVSGDFYVYGMSSQPFILKDNELIGEEWENYIYVIRYDHDLNFRGVRTIGFDDSSGEYANYRQVTLCPNRKGDVVLAGLWVGDRTPVMDGYTFASVGFNNIGVFALKLDQGLKRVWALEGSLEGEDYDFGSAIDEGLALQDGSIVFTGRTVTGFFNLGDLNLKWDNGVNFSNQFAFRLDPMGESDWDVEINNMADAYLGKGSQSDHNKTYFDQDAINWGDKTLYMTGKFGGDEFVFAGKPLNKELYEGAFVVAIDMESGDELWGYGMSSDFFELSGFDLDRSGNVSLLGRSSAKQDFPAVEVAADSGTNPLFLLGLDHKLQPLWKNDGFIGGRTWGYTASDLEVLEDGTLFATMYKTQPEAFEIGGVPLNTQRTNSLMLVSLRAPNAVGGVISNEAGSAIQGARIRAFKSTRLGAQPVMDSVLTNDAGFYNFSGLYPGNYIFQVVPDEKLHPDGMITYSGGAIRWNDAEVLPIKVSSNTDFKNIKLSELAKLSPDGGSGKASGNISYADDPNEIVEKGTMGRPSKKTSVILIKKASSKGTLEDNVVAYVSTDDDGNFLFEHVPNGEYTLIVDVPGLLMAGTYDIVIEDEVVVSGLDFQIEDENIVKVGGTGILTRQLPTVSLYPNPGNGILFMEITQGGDYQVEVFDSFGKLHGKEVFYGESGLVKMDVSDLDDGLYLIKIQGDAGSTTLKYLKY